MRLYVDVYVQHIHQHRGIEVRVYVDVYVQHIHQHGGQFLIKILLKSIDSKPDAPLC